MSNNYLHRSEKNLASACGSDDSSSPKSLPPPADQENNFARRMRLLIQSEGSMASIARRCGFSEGAVRSWRDGQSDISRERCIAMATVLNVSLVWLIVGQGPMRPSVAANVPDEHPPQEHCEPLRGSAVRYREDEIARPPRPAVDSRVLASALRLLQSYVGLLGGSLSPAQRADDLAELYGILREVDEPEYIDRLITFHNTLSGQMRRVSLLTA